MRREIVQPNGTLVLGVDARRHGFLPGAVVDVVVLSSGSLLVRLDDSAPAADATWRPLYGGAAQKALRDPRRTA